MTPLKQTFLEIWNEREHVSELSGEPLGMEPLAQFFSHILPKSKSMYPRYATLKENIVLLTFKEHMDWTAGRTDDSRWDWIKAKYEELRIRYNQENKNPKPLFL